MTGDYEYKVGGSLGEDAPSYVRRQANSDLYYGLRAGELCYVFNSRQMGKTSLLVRTMKQLQADGFACAVIDISGLGSQDISLEQWYASIVDSLLTELNFIEPEDLVVWWDKSIEISPVRRLAKLFDELLLPNISQNIVIFLDEIDSILRLEFPADDFFALIRSCYQRRSFKAEYRRLTFALVGVATPSDLIKDEERTPFNIGTAIQLYGFKLDEIAPLAKGLEGKVENPQALMREVLAWTGGQPLLTQKVCNLLIRDLKNPNQLATRREKWVEGVVRSGIIDNWEAEDEQEHLKTIPKLWSLEGLKITTLKDNARINNIVFSPDGKTVATTSSDSTAKLWNLQKGEIVTLKHDGEVNHAVFSPDGKTIATTT